MGNPEAKPAAKKESQPSSKLLGMPEVKGLSCMYPYIDQLVGIIVLFKCNEDNEANSIMVN